ncbi:hypothetical protein D2E29_11870 [Mycobacteroides abscessus]|uniref:hypothetical protein n=1 Tax=Mycobacteroides abscessus TaxID=36809 RepID=UPI0005DABAF7|nr:hypothetical protein [Mycobacteroides abscessus]MBE5508020.1 hypothetical protein [Mycobacteroides abscessus]MBN7384543.1 hypothetical protein [Mycobacteroides abscessus subsp. abscessus]MBN7415289.1 hypothetical protein [Mycobacteroides abscessus subsp. abscessus]MBN7484794.1 hypothetical protein [Mycobacteroides abscessus subsp. abscessus]MDB2189626.1 hypothetical protein [Mycobacteroides abscessus subsp. abscessus]
MKHTHKLGAAAAALATGVSALTAPTAVAGTHTVTYSVWVDVPAPNGFSVGYATGDGPDRAGDPNLSLVPGEVWTHEVTMDNPTQWAYLDVVYHGAPANPRGTHCEIKVDGAVKSSGASICSIQPLRAGFGPPGTM